jgi:hypothetical protein
MQIKFKEKEAELRFQKSVYGFLAGLSVVVVVFFLLVVLIGMVSP